VRMSAAMIVDIRDQPELTRERKTCLGPEAARESSSGVNPRPRSARVRRARLAD